MTKKLTAVLLFGLLVLSACSTAGGGASTPSGAVQGFADAINAKDYAKFVGYLSTSSVDQLAEMMEMFITMGNEDEEAKAEIEEQLGMSIEDFEKLDNKAKLVKIFEAMPEMAEDFEGPGDFEIVNEEIDGDNATVTIKADGEETEIPLIKEADGWKIDFGM